MINKPTLQYFVDYNYPLHRLKQDFDRLKLDESTTTVLLNCWSTDNGGNTQVLVYSTNPKDIEAIKKSFTY